MAKELNPSIVKHVVREWLSSKDAVISMVVNELAARLAPIAARESAELLAVAINTSAKEQRIEELEQALMSLVGGLQYLMGVADSSILKQEVLGLCAAMQSRAMTFLPQWPDVQSQLAVAELNEIMEKAEKGGAA